MKIKVRSEDPVVMAMDWLAELRDGSLERFHGDALAQLHDDGLAPLHDDGGVQSHGDGFAWFHDDGLGGFQDSGHAQFYGDGLARFHDDSDAQARDRGQARFDDDDAFDDDARFHDDDARFHDDNPAWAHDDGLARFHGPAAMHGEADDYGSAADTVPSVNTPDGRVAVRASVEITQRAVIGDELRIPIAWCEMNSCVSHHSDPLALGEADIRARAIAAGWRVDGLSRLACPKCQQRASGFWAAQPVALWDRNRAVTLTALLARVARRNAAGDAAAKTEAGAGAITAPRPVVSHSPSRGRHREHAGRFGRTR